MACLGIRDVSAMYPQCMLLDTLGILLNDFLNQTLGSMIESICCHVHFGDLSRMSRANDLLEGWREGGREGQSGGDGKRELTNCHSLGRESDKGRDGGGGQKSQKSKVYPQSHSV